MKPILFNTEMVRAILEGRKTATRRLVKPQPPEGIRAMFQAPSSKEWRSDGTDVWYENKPPYSPGDIMWVRETWAKQFGIYFYRAGPFPNGTIHTERWRPSIHMPREAARLFLRVTAVRAERIQDIRTKNALSEGAWTTENACPFSLLAEKYPNAKSNVIAAFANLWDSTIKSADLPRYGFNANPWVWVIEFERCEKPTEGDLNG